MRFITVWIHKFALIMFANVTGVGGTPPIALSEHPLCSLRSLSFT